jgi:hypothetical protein
MKAPTAGLDTGENPPPAHADVRTPQGRSIRSECSTHTSSERFLERLAVVNTKPGVRTDGKATWYATRSAGPSGNSQNNAHTRHHATTRTSSVHLAERRIRCNKNSLFRSTGTRQRTRQRENWSGGQGHAPKSWLKPTQSSPDEDVLDTSCGIKRGAAARVRT